MTAKLAEMSSHTADDDTALGPNAALSPTRRRRAKTSGSALSRVNHLGIERRAYRIKNTCAWMPTSDSSVVFAMFPAAVTEPTAKSKEIFAEKKKVAHDFPQVKSSVDAASDDREGATHEYYEMVDSVSAGPDLDGVVDGVAGGRQCRTIEDKHEDGWRTVPGIARFCRDETFRICELGANQSFSIFLPVLTLFFTTLLDSCANDPTTGRQICRRGSWTAFGLIRLSKEG